MRKTLLFAVGSKNRIKIGSVRRAVRKYWPNSKVVGVSTVSGAGDQPLGEEKTKRGAIERAKEALKSLGKADFGVGLESGVDFRNGDAWTLGYIAVVNKDGKVGLSKTLEFVLPPRISQLIKKGIEQGRADSIVFRRKDSGERGGTVELLTSGHIKRIDVFYQAVIFALVSFINPKYYKR